jgi:hypothetical protein
MSGDTTDGDEVWVHAPMSGHRKWLPDNDPARFPDTAGAVRLMPEYEVDIPLWGPWDHLSLSAELLERLRRWQRFFDSSFRWDTGWISESERDEWSDVAASLESDLRHEVGDRAEVIVNLWPLES